MAFVVDNFAGGGGASTGIEAALGFPINVAINHDPQAIAMHKANHPLTSHYCQSIYSVDPLDVVRDNGGQKIDLAWFSPDCTHFSKARGGKPSEKRIRDLALVIPHWVERLKPFNLHPRVIMLENVEEFTTWGPLTADNKPCPEGKGRDFKKWVNRLRRAGYQVQWKFLTASDFGAPTKRRRLFIIARSDNQPIVWPAETHGPGRPWPWRAVSEVIDWSIPCPSIFTRSKPLVDATCRRIALGIQRHVIDTATPFIVPITHSSNRPMAHSVDQPLRTITTAKGGEFALVTAFMAQHNGGNGCLPRSMAAPLSTITTTGTQQQIVTSNLIKLRRNCVGQAVTDPVGTITAGGEHFAEVRAFLVKYYGSPLGQYQAVNEPIHTIPTKARFGLVTVNIAGEEYAIADIGMRMLTARELYSAQGFPEDYEIAVQFDGKALPKRAQIRMCGNSVSPVIPEALVSANLPDICLKQRIAA